MVCVPQTGGNEQLIALEASRNLQRIIPDAIQAVACPSSPRRRATHDAVPGSSVLPTQVLDIPPPVKRARTENDVTQPSAANTSINSTASSKKTSSLAVNGKKAKGRAKKPVPEPWTSKDFKTRFPHPAAFVLYLNGPSEERHPIVLHKDAPLNGVRAFFVSHHHTLSKAMAVTMNHLFRLGGTIQDAFKSPFGKTTTTGPSNNGHTTHVIVYTDGNLEMKFKDVLKALTLADEVSLVGQSVADGENSTSRDVWVIRSDWIVQCVKQADQQRDSGQKAKKLSEMGFLIECEGDKKRRKNFLLRRQSTASVVADPRQDMEDFHMPESQIST